MLKEKVKEKWDMFSRLSLKEKLNYIWDYYKILIFVVIFILFIILISVSTRTDSKTSLFDAVFVNCNRADTHPEMLDALMEDSGYDMTSYEITVTDSIYIGSQQSENAASGSQGTQLLAGMFLAGSVDVFVADESTFSSFAIQGTFSDLSELIDPSALSSLDAELYRCENADGDEIIAGIVLHQGSPLHEAGYYQGDVVIGIAATSKNTDSAIAFLKSLL